MKFTRVGAKRAKGKRVTKARFLFDELMEGVEDMRRQREGKITLCSHVVTERSP